MPIAHTPHFAVKTLGILALVAALLGLGFSAALAQNGPIPTQSLVTSSLNPSSYGQPVTFTGQIIPTQPQLGVGLPSLTGTIAFQDGGGNIPGCEAVPIPTLAAKNSAGVVLPSPICTVLSLTPGNHNITAVYSGDSSYSGSTSPVLVQVVVGAVPEVPEAGTLVLFGSGLGGLLTWLRFKRAK